METKQVDDQILPVVGNLVPPGAEPAGSNGNRKHENGNGRLALSEIEHLKSLETLSDKCKICTQVPEDLRLQMYKDHMLGAGSLETLAERYSLKLKERGINVVLNQVNLHTHFKNHFQMDKIKRQIALDHMQSKLRQTLAIVDDEHNAKSIFDLVESGVIDNIKVLTKAVLLSKSKQKILGTSTSKNWFTRG